MLSDYKNAVPIQQTDGTWLLAYQVTDEAGKPVGSQTVLTGKSERECWQKARDSHTEAQQAIDRLRKRQTTYVPGTLTDPEKEALAARQKADQAEGARQSYLFLQRHAFSRDFNNCAANNKALEEYITLNGLAWTADNLDTAFEKLTAEGKLAPPAAVAPVETTVEVIVPPIEVPWTPNPMTRESFSAMPAKEQRSHMNSKDPAIKEEFYRQFADLGLTISDTGRL